MKHSTAADAEFLEQHSEAAMTGLHRDHLLNVQIDDLIRECSCSGGGSSPGASSTSPAAPPAWLDRAEQYLKVLAHAILGCSVSSTVIDDDDGGRTRHGGLHVRRVLLPNDFSSQSQQQQPVVLLTKRANAHMVPVFVLTVLISNGGTTTEHSSYYKKDRYFDQRTALIRSIAAQLMGESAAKKKKGADVRWHGTVQFQYEHADRRKLCLIVTPPVTASSQAADNNNKKHSKKQRNGGSNKKKKSAAGSDQDDNNDDSRMIVFRKLRFKVQIQFQMESIDWIPPLRLVPNRCNMSTMTTASGGAGQSVHYNSCLTEDALHCWNSGSCQQHDFPELAAVFQIWCLQRGFWRGHDTCGPTTTAALLCYLQRTNRLHLRFTRTQQLTVLFQFVLELVAASTNPRQQKKRPCVIPRDDSTSEVQTIDRSAIANLYRQTTAESPLTDHDPPTLLELYRQTHTAVLLDPAMRHNYLFRFSPAFCRSLALQVERSLKQIRSANLDALLLTSARFWDRHDAYLQIPLADVDASKISAASRSDLGLYEAISRQVVATLRTALTDRIVDLTVLTSGNGTIERNEKNDDNDDDTDEIPVYDQPLSTASVAVSPTGRSSLVLGITLNPDTCFRVVDRASGADTGADAFLQLWGPKAELRRFKDGAIVHACVWEEESSNEDDGSYISFHNDDTWQGGIVERIVRHILKIHFLKDASNNKRQLPQFSLRYMASTVDGVATKQSTLFTNPLSAHRSVMKAFDSFTDLLRKKSAMNLSGTTPITKNALGIPLTIDAVEALSPALRYTSLYPPVPHPLIGGASIASQTKTSSEILTDPINIQIRFGASSKWPTDLKAIGAAKTAMLVGVANGLEGLRDRDMGPIHVTPLYADICYKGYVFRVYVRADPELKILRSVRSPSAEAVSLLQNLTQTTVIAARHHSTTHAIYTKHPSSSAVLRMAQRWLSTHLLSGQITFEALELMVVYVYSDRLSPMSSPGSIVAGFLRFLHLLAKYDWKRQPLIVDPQEHFSEDDLSSILSQFEATRGDSYENGPAMYIISLYNHGFEDDDNPNQKKDNRYQKTWVPTFTATVPERVVLSRAVVLAERTYKFLHAALVNFENRSWPAAFQESADSFRAYSALLRVDPAFLVNTDASSTASDKSLVVSVNSKSEQLESTFTRSMRFLAEGPKDLRRKLYRNLMANESDDDVVLDFRPIQVAVSTLRAKLGTKALFFYNDLCPDVIAIVWRRALLQQHPFSAVMSEYVRPVAEDDWKSDTMVTLNIHDVLRETTCCTADMVVDMKIFDTGAKIQPSVGKKRLRDDDDEDAVVGRQALDSDSDASESS
jgi:U3 small nucleolar RNA-associated protein 22